MELVQTRDQGKLLYFGRMVVVGLMPSSMCMCVRYVGTAQFFKQPTVGKKKK